MSGLIRLLLAGLLAFLALPALGRDAPAGASCGGRDLVADLAGRDGAAHAEFLRRAADVPHGRGRLFRLSRPDRKPSFLFGTMHTADARVRLSAAVGAALEAAETVALELAESDRLDDPRIWETAGPALLRAMLARVEERPDRLLPAEAVTALAGALEARGLPRSGARSFKPSFLALAVGLPPCAVERDRARPFLDAAIARRAAERGLAVRGLETVTEQLDSVARFDPAVQAEILRVVIERLATEEDAYETLVQLYARGEFGQILTLMRPNPGGIEALTLPEPMVAALLDERNERLFRRALPLVEAGGAFVAVGAGHLPGENGLVRLFEDDGFVIEVVEED